MGKRDDKTEKPSPKKLHDAKKKGTIAKSQDLCAWATMLAATYAIPATVRSASKVVITSLQSVRKVSETSDPQDAVNMLGTALQGAVFATMPVLLACMAIGIVTHFAQAGLVVSLHRLKPDFKRINPINGIKSLVSPKSLWQTAKQIAKSAIIAWLAWPHVRSVADHLTQGDRVPVLEGLSMTARELMAMTRVVCWSVLVVAMADYVFQRREKMTNLMMSKQEVKDEAKNSEGDPQIKGRIRSMQMAVARRRMMSAIPEATVVITNPTHIAVAIKYDPGVGGAPKIVAVGVDAVAAKIRERARAAGVPIVESVPLARALWRTCDLGDEIPVVLYEAVAKVLAFVRRLRGGLLAGSVSALPLPRSYHVDHEVLDSLPARSRRRGRRPATPRLAA